MPLSGIFTQQGSGKHHGGLVSGNHHGKLHVQLTQHALLYRIQQ
ncbi:Uncharacterised protein [Enterobacter cloacae]|nr:Uncharacterised protein [Enterobacter cloacae]